MTPRRKVTGATACLPLARASACKLCEHLRLHDYKGKRILEFGAGRGGMLRAMAELGADICAVEPYGCSYLRDEGIEVYGTVGEISKRDSFEEVITINVLEHLPRAWEAMAQLADVLKGAGWAYVATLNPHGLNARLNSRDGGR